MISELWVELWSQGAMGQRYGAQMGLWGNMSSHGAMGFV